MKKAILIIAILAIAITAQARTARQVGEAFGLYETSDARHIKALLGYMADKEPIYHGGTITTKPAIYDADGDSVKHEAITDSTLSGYIIRGVIVKDRERKLVNIGVINATKDTAWIRKIWIEKIRDAWGYKADGSAVPDVEDLPVKQP